MIAENARRTAAPVAPPSYTALHQDPAGSPGATHRNPGASALPPGEGTGMKGQTPAGEESPGGVRRPGDPANAGETILPPTPDKPPVETPPPKPDGQIECFEGHNDVVNCVALSPD